MTNVKCSFLRAAVLSSFLAVAFLIFPVSAYAEMEPSRFGEWMKIASDACHISAQSTLPVTAPIADFLVDPFNILEGVYTNIHYAYPRLNPQTPSMTLDSYLQRSSIRVRGDTITIDGVDYQDIWITNDAAQALRTNVLDLQTAFEIASNRSGNFVSGSGFLDGVPMFDVGGTVRSQNYRISFLPSGGVSSISDLWTVRQTSVDSSSNLLKTFYSDTQLGQSQLPPSSFPCTFILTHSSGIAYYFIYNSANRLTQTGTHSLSTYLSSPFDFTWVAQDIPAPTLSSDDGLHLYVPNNPDQYSDPVMQQKINNFNLYVENNIELDSLIDLSLSDNFSLFNSLFDHALEVEINPSFGPFNISPPTPTPAPTEPVPWPTLEPTPTLAPTPTPDPTPEPSVEPTSRPSPGPDTPMSDVTWSGFSDWADNLESSFFGAVVDVIGGAFESLWNIIKSATGIWRYVVMWVGNISAPLNWSLTALGSAGSYFLSPFAAIAAAAVVISVYRRIGK